MLTREEKIKDLAEAIGVAFQTAQTTRFSEIAEALVDMGYGSEKRVSQEIFNYLQKYFEDSDNTYRAIIYNNGSGEYYERIEDILNGARHKINM